MSKKSQMAAILEKNKGVLRTAEAVAAGISRTYLGEVVRESGLVRVAHGIYLAPDAWEDGLFLLQSRFPKAVFSHETALFLLGFSEREPLRYSVTVADNQNTSGIRKTGVAVCRVKRELYSLGIVELPTPAGHTVKTYNAERSLCDLLRRKNRIDIQDLQTALKSYVRTKGSNLPELMRFAKTFSVESKIRPYLEMLL